MWKTAFNYYVILSQEPASKKQTVVAKNGNAAAPAKKGKQDSSSDSSDTDSEDEVSVQVISRAFTICNF
jgi:hypothetical protein